MINWTLIIRGNQRLRKQAEQLYSPDVVLKEELSQKVHPLEVNKLLLC